MRTRQDFQTIYEQGPGVVFVAFATLQTQIDTLQKELKELRDRLGKDSHNSRKPLQAKFCAVKRILRRRIPASCFMIR